MNETKLDIGTYITRKEESVNKIFTELLNETPRIDFRKELKFDDNAKVKYSQMVVIVIEKLIEIAKAKGWGLCKNKEFIYIFNGVYWVPILANNSYTHFKQFLGKAAAKMGVDTIKAKHYQFQEELFKQFENAAYLPAPERSGNETLVNLANGTLEIRKDGSVRLRKHNSNDFLTYCLPYGYDKTATAPKYKKFLDEVVCETSQKILAEYIGSLFFDNSVLKIEAVLFLLGGGANGKSVFHDVILALLGAVNVSCYSLGNLTDAKGYYLAMIADKLVNYASETSSMLNSEIFKSLASGEPVSARLPHGKPMELHKYAKLIFNINELPKNVEHTNAFFRRHLIIPFDVTIPPEKQDKELASKIIKSEMPGVLNWVLDGLKRILAQKSFTSCEKVNEMMRTFKKESNSVLLFLDENNYKAGDPNRDKFVSLKVIYSEYKEFCSAEGYLAVSLKNFSQRLRSADYYMKRARQGMEVCIAENEKIPF